MCFRVLGNALHMLNAVCMDSSIRCTVCGSFKLSWDHKRPRLTCFFILLYGWTAIYVPAHALMNILANSCLGLLLVKQKWIFGFKSSYRHTMPIHRNEIMYAHFCPFLLGRYLGIKSPSHMVGVCPQTPLEEAAPCCFPGDNVWDTQFLLAFINTSSVFLISAILVSIKWHNFWHWGVLKCNL